MKLSLFLQYISLLLVFSIAGECNSLEKSSFLSSSKSINGIEKITDAGFKKDFLMYLFLSENFDYTNKYFYLSKDYLSKYFPGIKNEKEYETYMSEYNEIGYIKYLKILEVMKISHEKYKVIMLTKSEDEGLEILLKENYYFIYEDNRWKFNDIEVLQYLEEKER
jgi:hypothetical protein